MHATFAQGNFNRSLKRWDVRSVKNMTGVFYEAKRFNQNIASWDVGNMTNMTGMFAVATRFDRDLSLRRPVNVGNMGNIFSQSGLSRHNYRKIIGLPFLEKICGTNGNDTQLPLISTEMGESIRCAFFVIFDFFA